MLVVHQRCRALPWTPALGRWSCDRRVPAAFHSMLAGCLYVQILLVNDPVAKQIAQQWMRTLIDKSKARSKM